METIDKQLSARLEGRMKAGVFGKPIVDPKAFGGLYRTIGSVSFNGEKNPGEIGPVKNYIPNHEVLRLRSWQLFLESEIAQTVLSNHITWTIGSGLKLQSEPVKEVLQAEGSELNVQKFCKIVESRFKLYSKSRMSDYADMTNLNLMEAEAFKNAIIGGDVLVVLRFIDDVVKVQLIDGCHVQSPKFGSDWYPYPLNNGNKVINGIEINDRRQHIAYYVRKDYRTMEYERISARGTDSDALMAFMVYGSAYRLDSFRGMPMLSVMFETAKKLERYKEAAVSSAEERAKIVFAIEHDIFSTGENPLLKNTVKARDIDLSVGEGFVPRDDFGNALADNIEATTNKQTYNLPLGAHLKALESKNEMFFKDFYTTNVMLFCAAAGIPYEVAMAKYDSNYSASRGAMKQWEFNMQVQRYRFSFQFMQPIYDFWLEVQILQQKVKASGYLKARVQNDRMLLEAFRNARFVGPSVPHVDPEKEVKAERLKLGVAGAAIPLTTVEQSTENLNGGDSNANLEQFADELKNSNSLGVKIPEPAAKPGAPKP